MGALTQLLGGVTQVWPNVTFIVCVFVVVLYRPQRIGNPSLFMLGCFLFALSLIAPSTAAFVPEAKSAGPVPAMLGGANSTMANLINLSSIALYAVAFLATVSSLMPQGATQSSASSEELR